MPHCWKSHVAAHISYLFFVNYPTAKQGDSDCEVILCFGTKFWLSVDLTVRELEKVIYI